MEIADLGSSSEEPVWVLTFFGVNGDVTCSGCSADNSGAGKMLITKVIIATNSFMPILLSPQL